MFAFGVRAGAAPGLLDRDRPRTMISQEPWARPANAADRGCRAQQALGNRSSWPTRRARVRLSLGYEDGRGDQRRPTNAQAAMDDTLWPRASSSVSLATTVRNARSPGTPRSGAGRSMNRIRAAVAAGGSSPSSNSRSSKAVNGHKDVGPNLSERRHLVSQPVPTPGTGYRCSGCPGQGSAR